MTRVHLDEEPVVRKKKDPFTREGQKWSWDFALLVPVRDEDALRETKKRPTSLLRGDVDGAEHTLAKIVAAIRGAGLETCCYKSQKFDQVVVKVRASAARLGRHADATNFRMRLAPAEVSRRLAEGLADAVDVDDYVVYPRRNGWRYRGVEMDTAIVDAEGLCPLYGSSEHMFGEFRDDPDDAALYAKNARSESPFRGVDRVKLIMSALTHPVRDGGAGLPLEKLVAAEVVSAAFPRRAARNSNLACAHHRTVRTGLFGRASRTRREPSIRPKISQIDIDVTELENFEVRSGRPEPAVDFHAGSTTGASSSRSRPSGSSTGPGPGTCPWTASPTTTARRSASTSSSSPTTRRAAWESTTGLGGPHQISELSSSVTSKSIRLMFGRIDCSRCVLEARPKSSRRSIRIRAR